MKAGGIRVTDLSSAQRVSLPTVVDEVVRRLRELILSGAVKPGDRLVEERLTEQLGVSRPPLREAMRILQRDGLVQTLPRRGSMVTPITPDDVREIYALRGALERLAIEIGVPVLDETRLIPMREALELMSLAAEKADQDAILEANTLFHLGLVALPKNNRLIHAYDSISMQMRLCMAYNLRFRQELYGDPEDTVRRHQVLLDLIETGDSAGVLHELAHHGDRSFLHRLDEILGSET